MNSPTGKPKKLFYVAGSVIPSMSANSIHVMKMCQAFARSGMDVTLVLPELPVEEKLHGVDPYGFYGVEKVFRIKKIALGNYRGKNVRYMIRLYRYLCKEQPDFVYGRYAFGILVSVLARVPCALELHTVTSDRSRFIRYITRMLPFTRSYRGTVVISAALKTSIEEEVSSLKRRKILVAHDGADPVPESEFIVHHHQRGEMLKLGYIGHLYPGRGIDTIVQIAKALPFVEVHVVGGMEEDIRYWKMHGETANLVFHGHVPHAEVRSFQLSMDVLLAPYQRKVSVYGGGGDTSRYMSPLKLFEYMAAGKAIVCSDLPVLREILDESCAVMVPPEETKGWIDAVQQLKKATDLRTRLGYAAKNRLLERYTWDRRARMLYEGLMVNVKESRKGT